MLTESKYIYIDTFEQFEEPIDFLYIINEDYENEDEQCYLYPIAKKKEPQAKFFDDYLLIEDAHIYSDETRKDFFMCSYSLIGA